MIRRLYDWTLSLAERPRAVWALAAVSFTESSFFPIPPDVVLLPMCLAKPARAWFYAAVCTAASVAGGVFGYLIGALFFDTVGRWLIEFYGYGGKLEEVRQFYDSTGWLFILIAGFTPIPFKLVTIASGLLAYNFWIFVILSIITRGARFFLVAALMSRYGPFIRGFIDRNFMWLAILGIVLLIGGFWVALRVI